MARVAVVTHDKFDEAYKAVLNGDILFYYVAYSRPVFLESKHLKSWEKAGKQLIKKDPKGRGYLLGRGKNYDSILEGNLFISEYDNEGTAEGRVTANLVSPVIEEPKVIDKIVRVASHAVTAYDRKNSHKRDYNAYALSLYLGAVQELEEALKSGHKLELAVRSRFNDRLLDVVINALKKEDLWYYEDQMELKIEIERKKLKDYAVGIVKKIMKEFPTATEQQAENGLKNVFSAMSKEDAKHSNAKKVFPAAYDEEVWETRGDMGKHVWYGLTNKMRNFICSSAVHKVFKTLEPVAEGSKRSFLIIENNQPAFEKEFASVEYAEEYLENVLGEDYNDLRSDFNIVPTQHTNFRAQASADDDWDPAAQVASRIKRIGEQEFYKSPLYLRKSNLGGTTTYSFRLFLLKPEDCQSRIQENDCLDTYMTLEVVDAEAGSYKLALTRAAIRMQTKDENSRVSTEYLRIKNFSKTGTADTVVAQAEKFFKAVKKLLKDNIEKLPDVEEMLPVYEKYLA